MDSMTATVFTAAETAKWTRTNLGDRTEISHAGYTWTVERPVGGGTVRIVGREGWGGTELLDITDTPRPAEHPTLLLASDQALNRLAALIAR